MISDYMKAVYQKIHKETPFGKRRKFPKHLEKFINEIKPKTILDFGCGKGRLITTIKEKFPEIDVIGYDPANPLYDINIKNIKVDLLISCDVLEHIEPDTIDQTLLSLIDRSQYIYHLISLGPAKRTLPDGRNAHLIQETKEWWRDKFVKLNYNILKEDYAESTKIPKVTKIPLLVKNYFVMAKKNG